MNDAPHVGVRPRWVDNELFPFESRFVDIDGNTVHYVDEGGGDSAVLFLHGNPTYSLIYRHQIAALRDEFRCIALDFPGFGLSTAAPGYASLPEDHARVVVGFIDRLGLSGMTLVVQDWGGPIGMAAAEARPDAVARIVIGNTWAWPVNGDRHFEIFSRVMGGALGRALSMRFNMFVNVMIPKGHRRRKVTAAEMAQFRAALATPERRRATAIFPRQITASRVFLAEVETGLAALADRPVLIAWGDSDIAFRTVERKRWEAIFPDHTTVELRGAGHYVQSDAAEEFTAAIRHWLGSLREDGVPRDADEDEDEDV
jgi:haloalkane dehalogenase